MSAISSDNLRLAFTVDGECLSRGMNLHALTPRVSPENAF
jgi:hypothetical protein